MRGIDVGVGGWNYSYLGDERDQTRRECWFILGGEIMSSVIDRYQTVICGEKLGYQSMEICLLHHQHQQHVLYSTTSITTALTSETSPDSPGNGPRCRAGEDTALTSETLQRFPAAQTPRSSYSSIFAIYDHSH